MGQFDGIEKAFEGMFYAAIIGLVSIVGWATYGIWWVWHHVSLVAK